MILAALALATSPISARVDAVAAQANLAGVLLVAKGDTVLVEKGYGTVSPKGGRRHDPKAHWRLASITKQVTAALIVRDAATAGLSLDAPVAPLISEPTLGAVTLRQLLTHHSGLANPDETKPESPEGMPSFYLKSSPDLRYCLSRPARPGADFAYDNCDYIVAAAVPFGGAKRQWPAGMALAKPGDRLVPGFVHGAAETPFTLASFGAAGALTGTARAVFRFDRSLMTGALLSPAALADLWKPEGGRSYQALGQWVFPGRLKGCAVPKRIVQRDGEILGVQTRNFILPDDDIVVVIFTNRSADDFKLGEVWEGKGFTYDLLSAVACS